MPTQIVKGSDTTTFDYAPDNSRIYRKDKRGTEVTQTWYLGKVYEVAEKAGTTEERWYLGNVVLSKSSKNSALNYEVLHSDSQGSTVTVTDGAGALVSHSLYDAWGQQSSIFVGSTSQLFVQSLQRRGYTGHENVDGMGVIHMNGRIYDPLLARFVQADPTLQFAQYTQGYNRYAYVLNNPMTYTDPSGYFVKWMMKKNGTWDVLRAIASVPILDAVVTMAVCTVSTPAGCAIFIGLKTYAVTGSVGAGLRAGAISFATAQLSAQIGEKFKFAEGGWARFNNIAAHSVMGGIASVLEGGKFGHGFFSSMVSTSMKFIMEPQTGSYGDAVRRTMIAGMVGGTMSALTGGKFVNGAVSSAIQWWYNAEGNHVSDIYEAFGIGDDQALDSPLAEDAPITSQPQKSRVFSNGKPHKGTDYGVPVGTDVMVTADGVVVYAGYSDSFGNFILVKHKNDVYTRYAHGSKLLVTKGTVLGKGTVIMKSGNSGISSGAHLHYEVFKTSIPPASNGNWSQKLDYSNYYRAHELNRLLK